MAEFTVELQPLKQSFSDMDLLTNLSSFESLNSNELPSNNNFHGFPPHELPMNFNNENMSNSMDIPNVAVYDQVALFCPPGSVAGPSHVINSINKASESEYVIHSSSSISANEFLGTKKKNGNENQSGKKRKRNIDRKVEKPREVIHVRAKRGQATDSHSLAERLRREKINEKFRCLQDLVPGCYKTMGMAVMLDVIINYVRSLQNQIDLSAASLFHDFNSPDHADAMAGMQLMPQGMNAYEANGMERMLGEGYEGFPHQFQMSWPR